METILSTLKYICERSDWSITHLSAQKIMYMSQMVYMGRNEGQRLVNTRFEAWDYGPVSPNAYSLLKAFGSRPIPNIFKAIERPSGSYEETLSEACNYLLEKSPSELVANTHIAGGAWDKNYVPGEMGVFIPDADILDEYHFRMSK